MSTFCEDFPSECNNAITDDKEIEIVVDCEADPLGEGCDQPDQSSDIESDPEPIEDEENIDLVLDQEDQDESSAMESQEPIDMTMTFEKFVKIMHLVRYNANDSFAGNAAYSFLAFYMVTYHALQLWRYRSGASQYSLGAAASTNWYEIASLTSQYAGFSLWALLAFMQIFASWGFLGAINMMVWYWSAVLGSVSMLAVFVFRIMAMEDSYQFITDSTSSPATIANGELLYQAIQADVAEDATLFSMASFVVSWQFENWKTWQWNSMSPQEQEAMIESAENQMLKWQEEKLAEWENQEGEMNDTKTEED